MRLSRLSKQAPRGRLGTIPSRHHPIGFLSIGFGHVPAPFVCPERQVATPPPSLCWRHLRPRRRLQPGERKAAVHGCGAAERVRCEGCGESRVVESDQGEPLTASQPAGAARVELRQNAEIGVVEDLLPLLGSPEKGPRGET